MECTPGIVSGYLGKEAYKRRATGEGATFQEWRRTQVGCADCGDLVAASSLRHHVERSHGISLPQTRGVNVGGGGDHICGILPQGLENRGLPGAGMPSGGPQRQETAETFHVLALPFNGGGVAGGEGAAASL